MPLKSSSTLPYVIVLLLVVFGWGASGLNADTIWYDEWWSLYYSGTATQHGPIPLSETWVRVGSTFHELNPPGYYLALNLWGGLVGNAPATLRILSLLWGVLAVALVYRIGCDLDGPVAGLGAALTLVASAFFLYYLHEARAYAQLSFFAALVVWAYVRVMRRGAWWAQGLFALGLMGLLYTHYLGLPLIAALGLYHLLLVRRNRWWWRVILLALLAVVLFLPWTGAALNAFNKVNTDDTREFFARDSLTLLQRLLDRFSNASTALLLLLGWFALRGPRLTWILVILTFALTALINTLFRFITDVHYLLALWPLLALIAGAGLARARPARAAIAVIWVAMGVSLALSPRTVASGEWQLYLPWDAVRDGIETAALPGDTLIYGLPPPDPNWIHQPVAEYYLGDLGVSVDLIESLPDTPPARFDAVLRGFIDGLDHFWLAHDRDLPPSAFALPAFDAVLAEDYLRCDPGFDSKSVSLDLYLRDIPPASAYDFGTGIIVAPAQISHNADSLRVLLRTMVDTTAVPPYTYSIGVHVNDSPR